MQQATDMNIGASGAGNNGTPITDALSKRVRDKFDEAKAGRVQYELQWLKNTRQFMGVYDPEIEQKLDKNRSKAFIRLVRTKVKSMDARMMDMMFPAGGDKNWAIAPVPVSPADEAMVSRVAAASLRDATMNVHQAVSQAIAQAQGQAANGGTPAAPASPDPEEAGESAQGAPAAAPAPNMLQKFLAMIPPWVNPDGSVDPQALAEEVDRVADAALERRQEQAKDRCARMEQVIDSQLDVARYADKCGAVIHSGNLHGTGVLKGPLVENRNKGAWTEAKDAGSGYEYQSQRATAPYLEAVSLWDIYPDMHAHTAEDAEYIIQRHVMLRSDLRRLAKTSGFNAAAINAHIAENPGGDVKEQSFEASLKAINGKTQQTGTASRGPRYEVLEYWGYVDGRDLQAAGVTVPDEQLDHEFEANVWVIGTKVIKAVLNPFDAGYRPYHFYYFEKDETSIFGVGIAEIMMDVANVFNAAIRAAVDNAAMAAGPMFEINRSLLAPGEDVDAVLPFRIIETKGEGQQAAVRVIQVPNTSEALLALAEAFKLFGDESTSIPAYTQGEPTTHMSKTVGGLSMLMGQANITLKDTVRNFDQGITECSIRAIYHWNMQFNPDETIKGNYEISARGASSLVAKEIRSQQLQALAGETANPYDGPLFNRRKLREAQLKNLDLYADDLMYTDEEVKKNLKDAAANQPPDPAMLAYDLRKQELALKTLIEEGELQLKERAQALKEHEAAFQQRLAELNSMVGSLKETLQLRMSA